MVREDLRVEALPYVLNVRLVEGLNSTARRRMRSLIGPLTRREDVRIVSLFAWSTIAHHVVLGDERLNIAEGCGSRRDGNRATIGPRWLKMTAVQRVGGLDHCHVILAMLITTRARVRLPI